MTFFIILAIYLFSTFWYIMETHIDVSNCFHLNRKLGDTEDTPSPIKLIFLQLQNLLWCLK